MNDSIRYSSILFSWLHRYRSFRAKLSKMERLKTQKKGSKEGEKEEKL
jgi:hypothetical protein